MLLPLSVSSSTNQVLAGGLIVVEPLLSDRFDLSDGLSALERAAEPGVLKVMLDVSA